MRKIHYTATGIEALVAAAFFYAGTNALVRYMSPMWGDQAQVFARFAVAGLILIAINYSRKKNVVNALRGRIRIIIALSVLQALTILFYTLAVQETTIANMLFVSYATTMIVQFLLGSFVLKEEVNKLKLLALLLSFMGLVLYSHSFIAADKGILFSLLAGAMGAVVNVIYKKLANVDHWIVLQAQYVLGAVLLLALTFALGGDFVRDVSVQGSLITIAFAATVLVASYLLLYGYKRVDANIGTVLSSTELVFGVILGLVLFSETPSGWELASGLLITGGAMVGAIGERAKSRLERGTTQ